MIKKIRKINPVSYRIGFCFFWNKSINNSINKFNFFLKLIYVFSYFFTVIFEKFFKFKVLQLIFFFKNNQLLFNFNLYSFNLIYFSIFNLYLPKLYKKKLNFLNFWNIRKKVIKIKKNKKLKKKIKILLLKKKILKIQFFKFLNLKISNNKLFIFFLNELLIKILKKKINCNIYDNLELLKNKMILSRFLGHNLDLSKKLKLKIKNSFFQFLILMAWISLIQKNSYFFSKFITYGLKTRTQKIFLRFLRKFLLEFFLIELRFLKLKTPNFLKGVKIGLFGKLFGRRRTKKFYLKYYIKKTLLTSLNFKNINFTFLKIWTYYGAFGIKVWFFF